MRASTPRERERRLAAERKRSHGELANRVLGQGTDIRLEKLSYRAFQRCFGRSTKVRGAGSFASILTNKIAVAGGQLIEINPYKMALSRFDHTTSEYIKKPLNQRMHVFVDGITPSVQRDFYSAFLARCCGTPETLDIAEVKRHWPSAGSLLGRAMLRENQPVSGRGFAIPPAVKSCVAGGSSKAFEDRIEAGDGVAEARAPERTVRSNVKSPHGDDPSWEHTRVGNTLNSLGGISVPD
jgi:putative transposase